MINLTLQNPSALDDLTLFIDRLSNPPPSATKSVEDAIRAGFASNFATESAGGTPWEQLSLTTMLDRVIHGFSALHPILVRTGDYRSPFVDSGDGDALMEFFNMGDGWAMDVGSNDDRVSDLEDGTRRIPARPVTILSDASENNVIAALERMIIQLEQG